MLTLKKLCFSSLPENKNSERDVYVPLDQNILVLICLCSLVNSANWTFYVCDPQINLYHTDYIELKERFSVVYWILLPGQTGK